MAASAETTANHDAFTLLRQPTPYLPTLTAWERPPGAKAAIEMLTPAIGTSPGQGLLIMGHSMHSAASQNLIFRSTKRSSGGHDRIVGSAVSSGSNHVHNGSVRCARPGLGSMCTAHPSGTGGAFVGLNDSPRHRDTLVGCRSQPKWDARSRRRM